MKTVLMVAEKPSLATSLAKILSHGQSTSRKSSCRACQVHEYTGKFHGEPVYFKMTSVCGHVLSLDFEARFNNWDKVDPVELFSAPTEKKEASPDLNMERFLAQEARGVDYLVLWLDCDKEGENICFEVINAVKRSMNGGGRMSSVYRARFSAITDTEIRQAMQNLARPNENEARAVDARQELDLRIGCAFTRYQTRFFQGKYGDLDSTLISFGPCQTPTLAFCVERHDSIQTFKPEAFWRLDVRVQCGEHRVLSLDWERGRMFDREAVQMFAGVVRAESSATVLSVQRREKVKQRPVALNTVEMLRVASAGLGIGPSTTMMVAERLYTQGYISYPRTETTSYSSTFDLKAAIRPLERVRGMGEAVRDLLSSGGGHARGGHDVGDHPPITPLRAAGEEELGGDAWRLYQYVVAHFLASVSADCRYAATTLELRIAGELFSMTGKKVIKPGFTALLPSHAIRDDETVPDLASGAQLPVKDVRVADGQTSPPDYLTESELISLMEQHGIGTDASIPVHINNICQRNYVTVTAGRRLQPTPLGIVLVHGYQKIDRDLVQANMRGAIEKQLNLIAAGQADFDAVLEHTLATFRAKFQYFVAQIAGMDQLFEVTFSKLAESGRPLSRCGKCMRYMKYISAKPQRLYCAQCDETHALPPNGSIKLNKEIKCPLDNFELVLWSAGGRGKTYSLCPYCYSHPPFPGMKRASSCIQCYHPTCALALPKLAVAACDECEDGSLVIDPNSGPKWKMFCNTVACNVLLHLCADAFSVTVCEDALCEVCDAKLLSVQFHKDKTPLGDGETKRVACMFCDALLSSLVRWEHAVAKHPMHRRGGGGKRRGGGGHKRRSNKPKDKMAALEAYFV
ncbi:DNA topoisomerase 3-beta-1-like [Sycon ciliatum]|uniref:DNA topoisomerase 3-beta-1-like n=1 Tax=Sycon ciliatum TaxID=27933 RepID=UPI0031F64B99